MTVYGIYHNLQQQASKLYRHNRQGSIKTRERYQKAFNRFLRFLAEDYRLQKLENINSKHLAAYVAHLQAGGKSAATIKTDLAAIRFWHDKLSNPKHRLPDNRSFALERRKFGVVDRTWSADQLDSIVQKFRSSGQGKYADILLIAWYMGLRLHEIFRLDTATAKEALKTGVLTVKGKNGKVRKLELHQGARQVLERMLSKTQPGQKLFVPEGVQTHLEISRFQQAVIRCRKQLGLEGESGAPLTVHGLRHSYAADRYTELRDRGHSDRQSRKILSRKLGHNRASVVNCYLASVKKKGGCR